AQEEGGVIRQQEDIYSAIFTREVAGGRTQWTELEMLQRNPTFFDSPSWTWNDPVNPTYDIPPEELISLNDRVFYYWNGVNIQELFTHQSSVLIKSATNTDESINRNVARKITSIAPPGKRENGQSNINLPVNNYRYISFLLIFDMGNAGNQNISIQAFDISETQLLASVIARRINVGGRYWRAGILDITDDDIDNSGGEIIIKGRLFPFVFPNPGSITSFDGAYEIYQIYSHGAYFTTTQNGTAFAHITNGNIGDGRVRIRYFSSKGARPSTLTETNITQSNISDPGYLLPYASFDWRSIYLTESLVDSNNFIEDFYGMVQPSYQFDNIKTSSGNGYLIEGSNAGSYISGFMNYVFAGIGLEQNFNNAQPVTVTSYTSSNGLISANTGDSFDLAWPQLDLSGFGEEGIDWYIEDICTPDSTTRNDIVGQYYWLPMLSIYPYNRTIFF
ncbi:MAG: hypothetical protein ACO3UU_11785, partial [Minisyncoccia bacterium]